MTGPLPPPFADRRQFPLMLHEFTEILYDNARVRSNRLAELQELKVTKLELWKEERGWQHEFIMAYIHQTVLIVERTVDWKKETMGVMRVFTFHEKPYKRSVQAEDLVWIQGEEFRRPGSHICYRVDFTANEEPDVMELACAAGALQQYSGGYHLFGSMCYWFASGVSRILAARHPSYTLTLYNNEAGYLTGTRYINGLGQILPKDHPQDRVGRNATVDGEAANACPSLMAQNEPEPAIDGRRTYPFTTSFDQSQFVQDIIPSHMKLHTALSKHIIDLANEAKEMWTKLKSEWKDEFQAEFDRREAKIAEREGQVREREVKVANREENVATREVAVAKREAAAAELGTHEEMRQTIKGIMAQMNAEGGN